MGIRVVFVMTHDSIGVGEDGPTHEPIEHLLALRALPFFTDFRPADANETENDGVDFFTRALVLQALAARATVLPNSPSSLFLEATAHDTLHQVKEATESYKAFLAVADGKYPDQEFEARHRLVALEHMR